MKKYILFLTFCAWTFDTFAKPKKNQPAPARVAQPSQQPTETWEDVAKANNPAPANSNPACPPNSLETSPKHISLPEPQSDEDDNCLGSRQSAHSSPLERPKSPDSPTIFEAQQIEIAPETPRLSAEEIQRVQDIQETAKTLFKRFKQSLDEGWVTFTEHDTPAQAKPVSTKSWVEKFAGLPKAWWQEHITDKNRVEHFMRYAGIVRTYVILCQKQQAGELELFIKDLNESNDGEGNRWLDEALVHAIKDGRENTTRKLLNFSIPYLEGITPLTRSSVRDFLIKRAEQKRKALETEHEEFAHDMHDLARTIQATTNTDPQIPMIPIETLEDISRATALALTKGATGGYLPRIVEKK